MHEAAISDLDRAIGLDPGLEEAFSNRGISKLLLAKVEVALADFDLAIQLNPS